MLDYARRLTDRPTSISSADIDRLKGLGLDDRSVLDLCQIVCYFNYVNRLADGLGVELEDFWSDEEMIVSKAEFMERG